MQISVEQANEANEAVSTYFNYDEFSVQYRFATTPTVEYPYVPNNLSPDEYASGENLFEPFVIACTTCFSAEDTIGIENWTGKLNVYGDQE